MPLSTPPPLPPQLPSPALAALLFFATCAVFALLPVLLDLGGAK